MRTVSVEEAVGKIADGASVMIGGFMGVGAPERLPNWCGNANPIFA